MFTLLRDSVSSYQNYANIILFFDNGIVLQVKERNKPDSEAFDVFRFDGNSVQVDYEHLPMFMICLPSYSELKIPSLMACANALKEYAPLSNLIRKIGNFGPREFVNILQYMDRLDALESLGETILQGIHKPDFSIKIDDGRKRSQKIGLPANFISMVEKNFPQEAHSIIAEIQGSLLDSDDGNDVMEFGKWLQLYHDLEAFANGQTYNEYDKYVMHICHVHAQTGMKYAGICEYVARQEFKRFDYNVTHQGYRGQVEKARDVSKRVYLLPNETAREYDDYICRMKAVDWTPANLWLAKSHLAARQEVSVDEDSANAFAMRSSELASLNRTIDGYKFAVPETYKQLVDVGMTFHNCLPSCGPAYISGAINIVFVTPPQSEIPLYALEVGRNGKFLQIKKDHDLDVTDEDVLRVIRKYEQYTQTLASTVA